MLAILDSVLPLFLLIFVGFFAGKAKMLNEGGVKAIGTFVFYFAMPPLLFKLMATTDLERIWEPAFISVYLYAEALVFLGGAIFVGLVLRRPFAAMTVAGFGCSFSNGVLLGLPLMLAVFGEAGAAPALIVITLDVLLYSVVTLLLELAKVGPGERKSGMASLMQTMRSIALNPIVTSTVLGLAWGAMGLSVSGVADKTITLIGQAAPPTALFALGASLSLRTISGSLGTAAVMISGKLFIHPLLVILIGVFLIPLDPFWLAAAVVFAALPVGANVYIFAENYGIAIASASTAVLVSTGISMVTVTAVLWWFQAG